MKQKFIYICIAIFGLCFIINDVKAAGGSNGVTDPGSSMPGGKSSEYYVATSGATNTYMFDLVYSSGNSLEHIACAIIGPKAAYVSYDSSVHGSDCVRDSSLGSSADASSLSNIAKYLADGKELSELTNEINENSEKYSLEYLKKLNVVNEIGRLKKEYKGYFSSQRKNTQFGENGGDNSGYRILVQYVQGVVRDTKEDSKEDSNKYAPIKEASSVLSGFFNPNANCGSFTSQVIGNASSERAHLRTDTKDVGIAAGTKITSGFDCDQERRFRDVMDGTGYQIIWFDVNAVKPNYNYSIDAACMNCDNTNDLTKGTFFIQDTSNWNAIRNSVNVEDNNNVKNYFVKDGDDNYVCREEYKVTFPNSTVNVKARNGRYISVGLPEAVAGSSNFAPIKARRTITCRYSQKGIDNGTASWGGLVKLMNNLKSKNLDAGDVTLTYKENKSNGQTGYSQDKIKLDKITSKVISSTDGFGFSSGDASTWYKEMVVETYYRMPSNKNVYLYFEKDGSVSKSKTTKSSVEHTYKEISTGILPITFDITKTTTSKVTSTSGSSNIQGNIKLTYDLPSVATNINKAFSNSKDYFGEDYTSSDKNVYNTGDTDEEWLAGTACAKLWGIDTDGFNSCKNARTGNNKTDDCPTLLKGDDSDITNTSKNYVCPIKWDECYGNNNKCSSEKVKCTVTDSKNKICEITYGNNYKEKGLCTNYEACNVDVCYETVGKNTTNKSSDDTSCTLSMVWVDGTKYYTTETPISCSAATKQGYKTCPTNNPPINPPGGGGTKSCKAYDNYKYCQIINNNTGKVIDGENNSLKCEDALKKYDFIDNIKKDCSGDGGSGFKVIYRTIDLINPFPGINGNGRNAGSNWCTTDSNGKTQCRSNSYNIQNVIYNNRSTTSKKVYSKSPLYSFTLDSDTIKNIRNYNSGKDYGSSDGISCDKNGLKCISDFVHNYVKSGSCKSKSSTSFDSCRDS